MQLYKSDLIIYRIERAFETAQEAQMAIDNQRYNLAANRIYYAIFYIVLGLAAFKGFSSTKHVTLKGWFNKEFIFSGILDKSLYQIYNRAFDKRQEGDYDDFIYFQKEEVCNDYQDMLLFVNTLSSYIKALL